MERGAGHHTVNALRWLLVPVAAAGAWAVSIAVGVALHDAVQRLCPPDQFVSGLCVASWFPFAERVVFSISAALAAGLVVAACTLTAPHHRRVVALVALAIGSVVAFALASAADAYVEFAAAVSAGLLTLAWLRSRGWRSRRG